MSTTPLHCTVVHNTGSVYGMPCDNRPFLFTVLLISSKLLTSSLLVGLDRVHQKTAVSLRNMNTVVSAQGFVVYSEGLIVNEIY